MKKTTLFIMLIILLTFMTHCSSAKMNNTEYQMYKKIETKLEKLKDIIPLNKKQIEKLKQIEFEYLKEVSKLKRNSLTDRIKKKVKRLEIYRDDKIKDILTKGQYLKYTGKATKYLLHSPTERKEFQ